MKIFIKNMVTIRYKMIVQSELEALKIDYCKIDIGEIVINNKDVKYNLLQSGLELMNDVRSKIVENIKMS